jgi:hypothetical protein
MKLTLLIATALITSALTTQAQMPWAKTGATWYYSTTDVITFEGYNKISKTKDTLIQGKMCDVLKQEYSIYNYANAAIYNGTSGYAYTTLDTVTNKVYCFKNNSFKLLYKFNATVGSTWAIDVDTISINCNKDTIVVDSVDTIVQNGNNLRRLFVHSKANKLLLGNVIIEGIGALQGMFPSPMCVLDFPSQNIRCFTDSSTNYQTNPSTWGTNSNPNSACDYVYVTKVNNLTNTSLLTIYPNPSATSITITGQQSINSISLINTLGQVVLQQNNSTHTTITINVSLLANGMYTLRSTLSNGAVQLNKITVTN